MAITCLTEDNTLVDKLIALYGAGDVIVLSALHQLKESVVSATEVVVVDLKFTTLPESHKIPIPVVALTAVPKFQEALLLLQRGVQGYGNRHMRQDNLDQAISNVKVGQIWLPPTIIAKLISTVGSGSVVQPNNDLLSNLSKREQEVALYVAKGMSNQEMADKMFVSLRTVKAHLSSVYEKTGLRNRLELGLQLKNSAHVL